MACGGPRLSDVESADLAARQPERERERDEGRGKKRNLLLPFVAYNVVVGSIGRGPDVTTLPFDRPRRNIPFLLLTRPACCKEGREQVVTVAGLQRAQ